MIVKYTFNIKFSSFHLADNLETAPVTEALYFSQAIRSQMFIVKFMLCVDIMHAYFIAITLYMYFYSYIIRIYVNNSYIRSYLYVCISIKYVVSGLCMTASH